MLEEHDGDWQEREEVSFGDIPDGKYVARIEKAEVNKSKASGRLQVSWTIRIAEGDLVNRTVFKHDGLDNPQSMGYFSSGINRLGEDIPESLKGIPELLETLIDTFCEITLRTKGENQNCYFNKPIDDDAVDLEGLEEAPGEEAEAEETKDPGEDPEEEAEIEVGDSVYGPEFGEDEPAEVTKITKKGKATIKYESDDTTGTFDVEELTTIESEEEEEAESGEDENTEEAEMEFDFDDETLKSSDKKKIKALGKEHDYKSSSFDSLSEMLFDIAEYLEIPADTYDSAKEVFTAIEELDE